MRFWLFLSVLIIALHAEALVIRSNPPPDTCPADKPLAYWEGCQPEEKGCLPGGFKGDFWKSTCYACDADIEIPQYGRWSGETYIEPRCSEYCPNRFINRARSCVLNTFWNRLKDKMTDLLGNGYIPLLIFFVFPFIFSSAYVLRRHKKTGVIIGIIFLGINIPLRFIPLILGLILTIPLCVWIVFKDVYQWVSHKMCPPKQRHKREITVLSTILFVSVLGWICPYVPVILFLVIMPLYVTISLDRLSKKENK